MYPDLAAILWKEWLQCRKNIVNEFAGLLVTVGVFGILPILAVYGETKNAGAFPIGGIMVVGMLLAGQLYCTLISEGVFGDEINEHTLRMLLTTSLNPLSIFVGKWLMLMLRVLVLISLLITTQLITITVSGGRYGSSDLYWTGCAAAFCLLYSSYCVGINGILSLMLRNSMQLRQAGVLVSLMPLGLVALSMSVFGFSWAATIRLTAVVLGMLCFASFAIALVVFRMEKVRL